MPQPPRILLGIEDSRAYGRGLLRGISKYARLHGPWLLRTRREYFHGGSPLGDSEVDLRQAGFAGMIIRELEPREMKRFFSLGVPVIVASHESLEPDQSSIMTDCTEIGRLAAEHFLDRGFRNFGYCGLRDMLWSQRRAVSFEKVIRSAGYAVEIYPEPKAKLDRTWGREQAILASWLQSLPKPIAILACTDDRARDLVEACEIAGLNVPEDIAVLGVDNDSLVCDLAGVAISSIALNTELAGFEAAALLHRLMADKQTKPEWIQVSATHIETRHSTDILAIEDRKVAQALNFIKNRIHQNLTVTDVSKKVGLNARQLYDRFQQALGRSVHDQINISRAERIRWLLDNTAMPILEIAHSIGLSDDKHLSRIFKNFYGISPIAWRASNKIAGKNRRKSKKNLTTESTESTESE